MEPVRTIDDLEKRGFQIDEGIAMCAGDEDIYMEVLETALEEGREKIPLIRELYENKDYERYCIEVHGLKNAMKTIGAERLSNAARAQEFAVKENELQLVEDGVDALLREYQQVLDALEELFENRM